MSDRFEMSTGQAHELAMALDRNGYKKEWVKKLSEGNFLASVLTVLMGNAVVQFVKHLVNLAGDCMPKAWKKEGWKIERHVGSGVLELDPSRLKLHFSPNQLDGKVIKGTDLSDELKAQNIPLLNGCVLDYLLAHTEIIPEDWKQDENGNTRYVYFWDTEYRGPSGRVYVRYLCWIGGRWYWLADWLDCAFDGCHPAALRAS